MTENKYVISGKETKGIDAAKKRSSVDLIEYMRFENQTYGILAKTTCNNNERVVQENTENRGDRFQYSETKTEVSRRNLLARRALIAVAVIVLISVAVAITVYFAVYYKSDSEATPEKTHSSTSATSPARQSTLTVTVDTTLSTEKTVVHSSTSTTSLPRPTTLISTVDTTPSTVSELTTFKSTTKDTVRTSAAETTTVTTNLPTTLPETTELPTVKSTTAETLRPSAAETTTVTTSIPTTLPETTVSELTTFKSTTKDTIRTSAAETTTVTTSIPTTLPETTGWTSWGPWTTCSVTCASGVHMRYRECHKVDSFSQDEECIGDYVKQEVCTTPACPVNGKWTLWSSWGTCDVSCGGGVQTRARTCQKSSHIDLDCIGDTTQEQSCNDWRCPDCSKICLVGTLNDACDTCVCESTTIEGRILSTAGNPIHGAVLAADTAPGRELAQSNSTGFFSLTATCLTSFIIVSRAGFQNKIVELSNTFQVIELAFEVLPRMTEQPRSKFRLAGEDAVFCCSAVSSPNITYYEWFHDSMLLNKSLYQNNGTILRLHSVEPASSGKYTCRANNPVRAVISAPAKLTVKDNEDEFCKDAFQQKKVSLPSTCTQPATNETTYETGYCLSKGCRRDTENISESCIDNLQSCCVPSRLESKTVNCIDYDLQIIVVKDCSCGSCDATRITVFGNGVGAISGSPLMYGEVWLNGEFVSRTNAFGKFTVSLSNSLDRAILTLKDTYKGEFLDAIKIIDITDSLSGRISITIPMLRAAPPVLIDPNVETILTTDSNNNDSVTDMAQISVPANSFYRKDGTKYSGTVSSRFTHINTTDMGMADVVPGRFQFINEEGSTTNLDSKGVFTLTFEDENGIPLDVDDVIDVSFPEKNDWNFTLWKLSKDTGNWEPLTAGIETKRRKRRRTEGLIGEIDMSQIESKTWLNIDKPFEQFENICFFKIRVYKDENLSEELIRQSGFRMEFHSTENNILTSYSKFTSFPAQTCFPASCLNNMAYIRFFYNSNGFYEDLRDLNAVDPLSSEFALVYDIMDGNKTFKAKMSSSANGPFYDDNAVCEASGTGDNHLRFRVPEADDGYIVQEVTPNLNSVEQLLIIKQQVWYPARAGVYSACFIKIKIDMYKKSSDNSETKLKFHVKSQGDMIAEMENFIFGIKEFTVDVSNGTSFQCIEYKCSGKLEDTDIIDYTRIKVGLLQPTSYHCSVRDVQTNLRNYSFEEYGRRNQFIGMYRIFDAYAPADYGPSLGIYQKETDNNDREGARVRGHEDCMKTRPIYNEGAAFKFHCV